MSSGRGFIWRSVLVLVISALLSGFFVFNAQAAVTSLTLTSPTGGENWSGDQLITWNFTASDGVGNINIHLSTNSGGNYDKLIAANVDVNLGQFNWNTTQTEAGSLPDGTTYRIRIQGDSGVDFSGFDFTVDNTPPTVNAGPDVLENEEFVQTGTVDDPTPGSGIDTIQWSRVSGPGTVTFGASDAAGTTILADADGEYTLRLTATDKAGNNASDDMILTWDTTPPEVADFTLNGGPADVFFNPGIVEIKVVANEPVKFNRLFICEIDDSTCSSSTAVKFFTQDDTFETEMVRTWDGKDSDEILVADGEYKLVVRTIDEAGNESVPEDILLPHSIFVDTEDPTIADFAAPKEDAVYKAANGVPFTFIPSDTGSGPLTCSYSTDGGVTLTDLTQCTSDSPTDEFATTGFVDGRNDVVVIVSDAAGNSVKMGQISIVFDDDDTLMVPGDFGTIQEAVNKAIENDISKVEVSDGTFEETVTVSGALNILGAQAGFDARNRSGAESVVGTAAGGFIVEADNVVIDGFTVAGVTACQQGGINLSPNFSGYQIVNNIISGNDLGLRLRSNGLTQSVIQQNLFQDNDWAFHNGSCDQVAKGIQTGFFAGDVVSNALIDGNKFMGQTEGDDSYSMNFVADSGENHSDVSISNNEVLDSSIVIANATGFSLSNNMIDISADTDDGSRTAVFIVGNVHDMVVSENTIGGKEFGFRIPDDFFGVPTPSSNISVNNNNLVNNSEFGVFVHDGRYDGVLDATNNYYGSANGPEHSSNTFNVGLQGDAVSNNVDFVPWCTEIGPAGCNFAPVTTTDPAGGQFSSIQTAIDGSNAGATVTPKLGVFTEDLNVGVENLTLKSMTALEVEVRGTVTITANGVSLNGFKITNFSQIPAPDWAGVYVPSGTGVMITDNHIDGSAIDPEANLTVGIHTLFGGAAGITAEGNTIENVRLGVYNQGATMEVTGNTIQNVTHSAIGIDTNLGTTIENNTIMNNHLGIEVFKSNVTANFNIIKDNDIGVDNFSGVLMDAERNWWGSLRGPHHSTNPLGEGDEVSDNVDFSPWCRTADLADCENGVPFDVLGSAGPLEELLLNFDPDSVVIPATSNLTISAVDADGILLVNDNRQIELNGGGNMKFDGIAGPALRNLADGKKVLELSNSVPETVNVIAKVSSVPFGEGTVTFTVGDGFSVSAINDFAEANNTYADGWRYRFNVTVSNLDEVSMFVAFADWVNTDNPTASVGINSNTRLLINPAGDLSGLVNPTNEQIESGTDTILSFGLGNTCSEQSASVNIGGIDLDKNPANGRQVQFDVFFKLPEGTAPGFYETTFAVVTGVSEGAALAECPTL